MEEIAQVYSRALFEIGQEQDKLDELREELSQFADALEENRDLAVFFFSPYFSSQEKKDGLGRVLEDADESLVNFLEMLVENHRMPAIFRINRQYEALWQEENKLLPVHITSAIELDDETVAHIGDTIGKLTGQRVDISRRVDPEILGGIILRVGNSILDASIRSRLNRLRKHVARAA